MSFVFTLDRRSAVGMRYEEPRVTRHQSPPLQGPDADDDFHSEFPNFDVRVIGGGEPNL